MGVQRVYLFLLAEDCPRTSASPIRWIRFFGIVLVLLVLGNYTARHWLARSSFCRGYSYCTHFSAAISPAYLPARISPLTTGHPHALWLSSRRHLGRAAGNIGVLCHPLYTGSVRCFGHPGAANCLRISRLRWWASIAAAPAKSAVVSSCFFRHDFRCGPLPMLSRRARLRFP